MIKILIYVAFGVILVLNNRVSGSDVVIGKHNNCKHYEKLFKQDLQLFYTCSLESTMKDFWLCKNCWVSFQNMTVNYDFLRITTDPDDGNVSCISELVDIDRLNYWHRIHEEAVKLWEDAHCYKCYDWNGTLINGTIVRNQSQSEDFQTFMALTKALESCENVSLQSSCERCEKNYTELNKFYEHIKKNYKNNICFDIENSMNRTRRHWSGDLGCCHDDKASFLIFSIMASIIGTLPVLFYFSTYVMTKRAERQFFVSDGETTQITPNVPSINNDVAMPGTSTNAILRINNQTKPHSSNSNAYQNTNIKDIVKQNNVDVNPNNFVVQPDANLRLIDLNN